MILLGFFQSIEFFVMAAVVAAAIVAYMSIPKSRGEAFTYTVAGELGNIPEPDEPAGSHNDESDTGWLLVECLDDGSVRLTRTGIRGITESGAVSIAATVTGFDVVIQERRTAGLNSGAACNSATFRLDFLAQEWYHLRYEYSDEGQYCSFSLHVKPGIKVRRRLKQ